MTTPIRNTFSIRLRANKKLSREEKELSQKKIESIFKKGFPNLFGNQRFGIEGMNPKQGSDILQKRSHIREKREVIFKIQAYASKIFNDYIQSRAKRGLQILDGDIVLHREKKGKNGFGIYQAKTGTIRIFDDTKKSEQFFRYPNMTKKELPFDPETMVIT